MRTQSLVFGGAAGIALACVVAILRAIGGHPEFDPAYLYLFGVGGGLGLAVMIWMDVADLLANSAASREKTYADADRLRADADFKRHALQAAAVTQKGTATPPDDSAGASALAQKWQDAVTQFFLNGEKAGGFSYDKLSGSVGSDTWDDWTNFYCSDQGRFTLQVVPGNKGTVWGEGQEMGKVIRAIRGGRMPMPPPFPDGPVPDISVLPARPAQHGAAQKGAKQARVIENAAKAAE